MTKEENLNKLTLNIQKNILKLSTKISFNCLENKLSIQIRLQVDKTILMMKNSLLSSQKREIFLRQRLKLKQNHCAKNMPKFKSTNCLKITQN